MSQRYLGGVITANPTTPTLASLSGVWTLEQQFQNFNVWSPEIVGNSVRLRSSASAYFNRTPSTASNQQKWTWSGWVKRGTLGAQQKIFFAGPSNSNFASFEFISGDNFQLFSYIGSTNAYLVSTQVFRDPSAWYHIVIAADSGQATASDRIKVYVNGSQITSFSTATYPSQNYNFPFNSAAAHAIGRDNANANNYFDGYLAELNWVDGQALTPSSFGAFDSTGVWQPLPYTGTYGTNGFYLTFSDNSAATAAALGKDTSGNGNNWTPNNISLTAGVTYDWMLDSPTNWIGADGGNGRGNYPVMNPIKSFTNNFTYSNANLTLSYSSSSNANAVATFFVPLSGKWYWEVTATAVATSASNLIGIVPDTSATASSISQIAYYRSNGEIANFSTAVTSGATYTSGDIIGVAVDAGAGTVQFYKNGVAQGATPSLSYTATQQVVPALYTDNVAGTKTYDVNFGQRSFTYTPPTDHKALNTLNLPTPTIMRGSQYMDINLWTGDQAARTITNSGLMQPDFLWTKSRSNAEDHRLSDSVRGGNGTVLGTLASNTTGAEAFDTDVTGFTSTGFNIRAGTNSPNVTGRTYVGWQWQAGRGTTSSNASGTITSTVSANTTAGFSIVSYTGTGSAATVGHGLGVVPRLIIVKSRSTAGDPWTVYSSSLANTQYLYLNSTAAAATGANIWNSTTPTSSVFSIGAAQDTNRSSGTYIAYCFAAVTGYSAFGTYTGNGSTDGPFIYLGFRPRFVLIKISSGTTDDWYIFDSARDTTNVVGNYLRPNVSTAEGTFGSLDFTSNGFKVRQSGAALNGSTYTYIYACFAENPFNISRAR